MSTYISACCNADISHADCEECNGEGYITVMTIIDNEEIQCGDCGGSCLSGSLFLCVECREIFNIGDAISEEVAG